MSDLLPARGEVWLIDLGNGRGPGSIILRPAIIISNNTINHSDSPTVMVLPITHRARKVRSRVATQPEDSGLTEIGYIKCEEPRSIARNRLQERRGSAPTDVLAEVGDRLRMILGLR